VPDDPAITTAHYGLGRIEVRLPEVRCCVEGCGQKGVVYHLTYGHVLTWYCTEHTPPRAGAGAKHDPPA
jgi:hypothetical protein